MASSLSHNDIEAELSYAYLHAVASAAGAACTYSARLSDNRGVDALLEVWGPFPKGGEKIEVDLKIQLKATISEPADLGTHFSYYLRDVGRYDDLRAKGVYSVPRILVVLYLPPKKTDWLASSADFLSLKKGAYWVSLVGAGETKNKSGVTIYLPKSQLLTPHALEEIFINLSHGIVPEYSIPESAK